MNMPRSLCRMCLAVALTSVLAACGQAAPTTSSLETPSQASDEIAQTAEVAQAAEVAPTATAAQPSSPDQAAAPSLTTTAPFELPLAASLPRSVTYASLQWTVSAGVIDNRKITLFGDSDELTDEYRVARITLRVENPLSGFTNLDSDIVQLQLGDGKLYEADETGRVDLPGGNAETESKLIFALPVDATWEDAKLVISESGRVPAELPLDGEMAAPEYPITLAAQGAATVDDVDYTILESSFDLDLHAKRTEQGEHFLKLNVRVQNNSSGGGGLPLSDDYFRLMVDGVPMAPADDFSELVKSNSAYEAMVVFAVPVDLSAADLSLGEGEQTATIPLDLKTTK